MDELHGTGSDDVRRALTELAEAREATYYDPVTDGAAQTAYYDGLGGDAGPDALFLALSDLVVGTHHTQPRYKPAVFLYPAVDLQPNGQLHSIYTGDEYAPETFIADDADVEDRRTEAVQARLAMAGTLSEADRMTIRAEVEADLPFNCEHVVPQSWFAKHEPMRGDLHHLFACEKTCNSFRGNTPYYDYTDFRDVIRQKCGKTGGSGFEPNEGKGPAARATLYFLLRYPQQAAVAQRLDQARLQLLRSWHETSPVSDYERHRNAVIQTKQGNRNPYIDHPDLVARTAFPPAPL